MNSYFKKLIDYTDKINKYEMPIFFFLMCILTILILLEFIYNV